MKHAKVAAVAVAASAMVGLGVAATGTAHAGPNGQQLSVCITGGDYSRIQVNGPNQDGQQQATFSDISPGGCTSIPGLRWKGQVTIAATGSRTGEFAEVVAGCDVPAAQTSDVFECRIQAAKPAPTDQGCNGFASILTAMRTSTYWSSWLVARTLTEYSFNPALVPHIIC